MELLRRPWRGAILGDLRQLAAAHRARRRSDARPALIAPHPPAAPARYRLRLIPAAPPADGAEGERRSSVLPRRSADWLLPPDGFPCKHTKGRDDYCPATAESLSLFAGKGPGPFLPRRIGSYCRLTGTRVKIYSGGLFGGADSGLRRRSRDHARSRVIASACAVAEMCEGLMVMSSCENLVEAFFVVVCKLRIFMQNKDFLASLNWEQRDTY